MKLWISCETFDNPQGEQEKVYELWLGEPEFDRMTKTFHKCEKGGDYLMTYYEGTLDYALPPLEPGEKMEIAVLIGNDQETAELVEEKIA